MKSSILRNAASLVSRVSRLRRAVLTAIAIARGRETGEIADLKGDLLLARLTGEGRGGSKVTSQSSFHGSKLQSLQSTRVTTTNSSRGGGKGERGREEEGAEGEGEMDGVGEEALSYICGLVFNAVCEAVARSHCQMYAGLRAGLGGGDRKGRESGGADSPSVDQMSRSCVDLSGQKTVRFRDPQTVDNPRAVLADMSLKFYSHSSIPPLRLEARIQLSIPRIHMEPRLSDIHIQFVQVTSALLSVLRNLSWWAGPGTGREFHVMWDASGAVDHMHTEILQSCRCEATLRLIFSCPPSIFPFPHLSLSSPSLSSLSLPPPPPLSPFPLLSLPFPSSLSLPPPLSPFPLLSLPSPSSLSPSFPFSS